MFWGGESQYYVEPLENRRGEKSLCIQLRNSPLLL